MSATENSGATWTAPYGVWKTLQNTIERMTKDGGVPARIDRSYLTNLPGSAQSELQTTMKALGLVDEQLHPTETLARLVENEGERPAIVKEILAERYPGPLALGPFSTQAQLEDEFRNHLGVSGSTLRKAVRFFLNAAKYADVPLSQHFKAPSAETGDRKPRKSKNPSNTGNAGAENTPKIDPPKTSNLHPFIEGLVGSLPAPGESFPGDKQEAWFDTARGIFRLIYKTEDVRRHDDEVDPEPSLKQD